MLKILVVTPFNETDWAWFGDNFQEDSFEWEITNLSLFGRKPWIWFYQGLKAAQEAKNYDIIISHHPYMAFYLALGMKLLGVKKEHHVFSFNHGNGRFFNGLMKIIAMQLFKDMSGFVVFSEYEKHIYGNYYRIPLEKFSFVHWAVNAPDIQGEPPSYLDLSRPYICCMGRNNRDFDMFIEVMAELGIPAVVVCKKDQAFSQPVPENIIIRKDIAYKEAMQVLANAAINVIPLKDASTGAGHITIVSAMQFGIPQVLTRVPTVSDYFIDGQHGAFFEPNSKNSLKMAILNLWNDQDKLNSIAKAAREFSKTWFMEDSSKEHLIAYLTSIKQRKPLPSTPPRWKNELS